MDHGTCAYVRGGGVQEPPKCEIPPESSGFGRSLLRLLVWGDLKFANLAKRHIFQEQLVRSTYRALEDLSDDVAAT